MWSSPVRPRPSKCLSYSRVFFHTVKFKFDLFHPSTTRDQVGLVKHPLNSTKLSSGPFFWWGAPRAILNLQQRNSILFFFVKGRYFYAYDLWGQCWCCCCCVVRWSDPSHAELQTRSSAIGISGGIYLEIYLWFKLAGHIPHLQTTSQISFFAARSILKIFSGKNSSRNDSQKWRSWRIRVRRPVIKFKHASSYPSTSTTPVPDVGRWRDFLSWMRMGVDEAQVGIPFLIVIVACHFGWRSQLLFQIESNFPKKCLHACAGHLYNKQCGDDFPVLRQTYQLRKRSRHIHL